MSANRLKLNMEKTEWLWMGSRSNLDRLPKNALQLNWDLGMTRLTSLYFTADLAGIGDRSECVMLNV